MDFKDYYETLGVDRSASADEIKRAYRKLARKYHPDVSDAADADEKFKAVNEAHEVLKDPEKRASYDQLGANWKAGQDFRPPPGWDGAGGAGFEYRGHGGGGHGFSDFFEQMFGGRAGFGGAGGAGFQMAGEDQRARIEISLDDAYNGATRALNLQTPEAGPNGQMTRRTRTLNVRIPKGVSDGQKIRLAGQGSPGAGGGPAGDLLLEVTLAPHKTFTVDGKDIHANLAIAPWEAALGAQVPVPTLGGEVTVKVQPGARSGQKLRLTGRGLPGKPPGDQLVTLQVQAPAADTDELKAAYEALEEAAKDFNPRS